MAMLTPQQLAKGGSEHAEQSAFFCYVQQYLQPTYPFLEKLLFAVPNGGSRGDNARSASIVGAKMKAEGVKPGVADIFLAYPVAPYHGLFIEMKRADGGTQSDHQKLFAYWAQWSGYKCVLCHGWLAAKDELHSYLGI